MVLVTSPVAVFSTVGAIGVASGIITPVESIISTIGVTVPESLGAIMLPDSVSETFSVSFVSVTTGIVSIVQLLVSMEPELLIVLVSVLISTMSVVPVLFSEGTVDGVSEIVVFAQDIARAIQSNDVFSVTGCCVSIVNQLAHFAVTR